MNENITDKSVLKKVVFPGLYGRGSGVIDEILREMSELQWSERDVFAVNMALEESITNAIEHGNYCDPSKNVYVSYFVAKDKVCVSVRDEGPGFDFAAVPDPRDAENREKPCGRGVLLIRGFMTKVWFNERGNEIFMEKNRSESVE